MHLFRRHCVHLSGSMQWRLHGHECTSPFLPIGQSWRHDEFPLLSRAHVLQAFIPAFDRFSDAQCKPHRLLVTFVSTGGQTDVEKRVTGL